MRGLGYLGLISAVLAVSAAMGPTGATGAEFHCSVEPCTTTIQPDGASGSKTSHHVLIIRKIIGGVEKASSMTCTQVTGTAEAQPKTVTELTATGISYDGCTMGGSPVNVEMNGCDYLFKAESETGQIKCPAGKTILLRIGTPALCTISTPEQTLKGISFHNVGSQEAVTTEITAEPHVKDIKGTAGSGCLGVLGFEGEYTEGEYTTGNTLLTGESNLGVMANSWWA